MALTKKQKEILNKVKIIEKELGYQERCFNVNICYICGEKLEWKQYRGIYCNKCKKWLK